MLSGLLEKLMVWTSSLIPSLILFLLLPGVVLCSTFEDELELFRKEISSMSRIISGLPHPDPGPSDIEELAANSPSKAKILLGTAREKFAKTASDHLNAEIVRIGNSVEASPTDDENYDKRRTILVALEAAARQTNLSVSSLFPKGAPSTHLPTENATGKAFDYCDTSFRYLAKLLFKKLPASLKASAGGSSGTGVSEDEPGISSPLPPGEKKTYPLPQRTSQSRHRQPVNPGELLGTYFYWVTCILVGLGGIGVVYHFRKSISKLSSLSKDALKDGKKDVKVFHNNTKDFKTAMRHFKANRFEKALESLNTLNTSEADSSSHNVIFYTILSEIRLCQQDRALKRVKETGFDTFTLEELYRIGHSLEEIGALQDSVNTYKIIKKRDSTFRNISQRINSVEQKMNSKEDSGNG